MQMEPIESSNVKAAAYDPDTRTLRVRFHSGKTFNYRDVSPAEHAEFMASPSKGAHLAKHIKGCHECEPHSESD